jgi:XTP/dITP diphosphohydrolase
MSKLLLATTNMGKVREYQQLFHDLPLEVVTLLDMGINTVVAEEYATYEENARHKAVSYANLTGMVTLADDSGLEVDALGGEPGVLSARYAGEGASDSDRVNLLLSRMIGVPREKRTARFKCVIALAIPGGNAETFYGDCSGLVTLAPRGKYGFGYDPIFFFPELDKTMAELSPEVKNSISHRARAAQKAHKRLAQLINEGKAWLN